VVTARQDFSLGQSRPYSFGLDVLLGPGMQVGPGPMRTGVAVPGKAGPLALPRNGMSFSKPDPL